MAAGGTSTSALAPLLRADIQKVVKLWSSEHLPNEGDKLVGGNKVSDTQSFIKMQQTTRPAQPGPIGERESLPEGRYDKQFSATYSAQKYGELLTFSREVWDDNQYRAATFGGYASDLMDLCHDVRDQALVNEFFNLVDTNVGPDGQAYVSATHPLEAEAAELTDDFTANASNLIPNNPTYSTDALNVANNMLKRQRDSKGQFNAAMGPGYLECDSSKEVYWRMIASPVNGFEPFTMDRNPGKDFAGMIAGVIGLTRSTHTSRWSYRTASKRNHFRFVWDRMTPKVSEMEYVRTDDTMRCNVIFRLSKGIFDWRGSVTSLAGS